MGRRKITSLEDRFWIKVDKSGDCWIWMSAKNPHGYGKFCISRQETAVAAHRVAWELTNGKIPDGMNLHHKCRNKACVNPSHLELISRSEHTRKQHREGTIGIPQRGKDGTFTKYYSEEEALKKACITLRKG